MSNKMTRKEKYLCCSAWTNTGRRITKDYQNTTRLNAINQFRKVLEAEERKMRGTDEWLRLQKIVCDTADLYALASFFPAPAGHPTPKGRVLADR